MRIAWKPQIESWLVLRWTAIAFLLVLVSVNSRQPVVSDVVASAVIPLIVFPIVDLVDGHRKGRSVARSIGHTVLSLAALGVVFATFFALQMTFGRPRNVDPFSESIDPAPRLLFALIVMVLAWAEIVRYFHLGPWVRKGAP